MRRALVLISFSFVAACREPPSLESQVRTHLAERDAKLRSYRLAGNTRELGQVGSFEFWCRAPNKVKGELKSPAHRTFSFDGSRLFDVDHDAKKFVAYELKLPPERAALVLAQTFSPFAPDGFRAPLLPQHGLVVDHSNPETVVVTTHADKGIAVSYTLRWPSMDFIEKRVTTPEGAARLHVDDESCVASLKLCFPKKLTNYEGDKAVATTEISIIDINPDIANDSFTLTAPAGYASETHQMVEQRR